MPNHTVPHVWVYPRVCGGTVAQQIDDIADDGLSPRVRGNRLLHIPLPLYLRSIPACAGEPAISLTRSRWPWVYPRVCGGTYWCAGCTLRKGGLSPRVRGNLERRVHRGDKLGSIPACAGEPSMV